MDEFNFWRNWKNLILGTFWALLNYWDFFQNSGYKILLLYFSPTLCKKSEQANESFLKFLLQMDKRMDIHRTFLLPWLSNKTKTKNTETNIKYLIIFFSLSSPVIFIFTSSVSLCLFLISCCFFLKNWHKLSFSSSIGGLVLKSSSSVSSCRPKLK